MGLPVYTRRTVAHAPIRVRTRSGVHVCHGEPICTAPKAPGSTVANPDDVDCDECLELLERAEKEQTHA